MLYRPGPGVLAKSSAKPPFCDRLVIEYAADAFLLGIFAPINCGSVYEFAEGVASPMIKKIQ